MNNYMIAIIVLLLFIFFSKVLNENANKKLTSEQKAQLIDLFSKSRTITFGILIVIIGIYFLVIKYQIFEPLVSITIYMVLLLIFIVVNAKSAYDKLKSNEFPDTFIKSYLIATTIRFIGILVFFALLLK